MPWFSYYEPYGKVGCRPSKSAKQRFRNKLKYLTSRKRPGTFKEILTQLNQVIVGWINYYKISFMKSFLEETQNWLRHRVRQLIWKRWKKVSTRYNQLKRLGIDHDNALKTAASRKGYWRISRSEVLHRSITNKRLIQWGLKDLILLYERK
ncbi:group II intron maturase-specific domain-containing protein [Carnobacterium sp. AT7]|uniref:group II intron maturase-specific domain-containing protein n=1 Tax=Carnobacterium sp. AT7 TaxID=333990 RepID=UPI0009FF4D7B|nr:group II intron maturase-specific domain-containing protein [Carnobacterium sp. AT7]